MDIPREHWLSQKLTYNVDAYIPSWEKRLRFEIEKEPDPAKRFDRWLAQKAADENGMGGVRLNFIEQPYLGWAEKVEEAIDAAEKSLRKTIAYEIENPDRDC